MASSNEFSRLRRLVAVTMLGATFQFPGCDLNAIDFGEMTTSSTINDARDVVKQLFEEVFLNPLDTAIDSQVDSFFDRLGP